MADNYKIQKPLLLEFLTPVPNVNKITEPIRGNTFYNAHAFDIIPFYKAISLLVTHENNLNGSESQIVPKT